MLKAYINEAVKVEKAGLKVRFKKTSEFKMPEEFQKKLNEIPGLKTAFKSLTPGRQRAYIFYFSQPKQSKTRISRIEKCEPMILSGIGLHDKYKSMKKFMKVFGVLSPSLMAVAALFKIQHWAGAGVMLVLGFFFLCFSCSHRLFMC